MKVYLSRNSQRFLASLNDRRSLFDILSGSKYPRMLILIALTLTVQSTELHLIKALLTVLIITACVAQRLPLSADFACTLWHKSVPLILTLGALIIDTPLEPRLRNQRWQVPTFKLGEVLVIWLDLQRAFLGLALNAFLLSMALLSSGKVLCSVSAVPIVQSYHYGRTALRPFPALSFDLHLLQSLQGRLLSDSCLPPFEEVDLVIASTLSTFGYLQIPDHLFGVQYCFAHLQTRLEIVFIIFGANVEKLCLLIWLLLLTLLVIQHWLK